MWVGPFRADAPRGRSRARILDTCGESFTRVWRSGQHGFVVDNVVARADRRREKALDVMADLELVRRWSEVGRVELVGAVAYGLVVSPDIDMEVFTPGTPQIRDGFRVLAELAEHPRVTRARFTNALSAADQGLYWQLRYCDDEGDEWKVDIWTLAQDHPGPLSTSLVGAMRSAVRSDERRRILALKEARAAGAARGVASIDIYRAVLDGGVTTPAELEAFLGPDYTPSLTPWLPSPHP
jgi:hypothetical protein